jgi:hypothetical protein
VVIGRAAAGPPRLGVGSGLERPLGRSGGGGDGPGAVVGEAEREEAFEIDRCAAVGPGEPVAVGAAVAESPVAVGDEPGDGAFDYGPVLVEPVGLGLVAGRGEQVVVGVQIDDPPAVAVVHRCRTGHLWQSPPKRAAPAGVMVTVTPSGQVTVTAVVSMM